MNWRGPFHAGGPSNELARCLDNLGNAIKNTSTAFLRFFTEPASHGRRRVYPAPPPIAFPRRPYGHPTTPGTVPGRAPARRSHPPAGTTHRERNIRCVGSRLT